MRTPTNVPNDKPKKIRPVTVTFTGELAQRLRESATCIGWRASTQAKQAVNFGLLMTEPTEEAEEFRRQSALQELSDRGRRQIVYVDNGTSS